jgi:hypothetical protein
MADLTGFIDPHIHAAPEHIPRLQDDIELARWALQAGMAGVLIKSHTTLTADRATIAQKVVPEIRVWGGLVLNYSVGGFNPAAVETALAYGAAEIWMPTLDAANHRAHHGGEGGLRLEEKPVLDAIHEILKVIASKDVILGTGHLSVDEICKVMDLARQEGVKKILITHPEAPFIAMPVAIQRDLARLGCRFERTWVFTTPVFKRIIQPGQIMDEIRQVGFASTVLATDMGQVGNPAPVDGLREYVETCQQSGFTKDQIERMGRANIAEWLP